jgi:hypothetical protein
LSPPCGFNRPTQEWSRGRSGDDVAPTAPAPQPLRPSVAPAASQSSEWQRSPSISGEFFPYTRHSEGSGWDRGELVALAPLDDEVMDRQARQANVRLPGMGRERARPSTGGQNVLRRLPLRRLADGVVRAAPILRNAKPLELHRPLGTTPQLAACGRAKRYGLGPNHPRFAEFTQALGHIVDPKSLPCIVPLRQSGRSDFGGTDVSGAEAFTLR